jgi:hypothetical protein
MKWFAGADCRVPWFYAVGDPENGAAALFHNFLQFFAYMEREAARFNCGEIPAFGYNPH